MKLSSFQDGVNFAVRREEEAINGYQKMAEDVQSEGVREMLRDFEKEERNHKKLLQELTRGKVKSFELHKVIDLKISDATEEEAAGAEMDFQDLLLFAAKKEQNAVDLYSHLKGLAGSEELKKLFEFLIEQEKNHKLKLEIEYEKYVLKED